MPRRLRSIGSACAPPPNASQTQRLLQPLPPRVPPEVHDQDELEFRFRLNAGELQQLMAGRTDMRTFSESIAKLIRRTALRAAKEPPVPTRRERADAFWAEFEKRRPRPSQRTPSTSRSLFDFVHPDFLPVEERRRQAHRVADAREEVPEVGPPRPDRLVLLPVADHDAYTHARRMKAWLPQAQRAVWPDLDPNREGDPVGRGNGDVLAFLLYVGVSPDEWSALAPNVRLTIRESVRELLVVPNAIAVALDPLDPKLAQRALELLGKLGKAAKNKGPKGFETALAQRERWAAGKGLYRFVTHLFDLVKMRFRSALIEKSGQKAAELAREVNTLLAERYGSDAACCTGKDIEALAAQSSADAAKKLVRRINPKVDIDSLERARPRHRNRRKKPPATRGGGSTGQ